MTTSGETLKFAKGAFYQDRKGDVWVCTNVKQKKVGDFQFAVMMQRTEGGQLVGEATEELVDSFAKQLTAAELKEYREVCQREREAEDAGKSMPATTTKAKSAKQPAATTEGSDEPKTKKVTKTKPASDQPKVKKMSALDAAATVLGEATESMGTKEMIDAMSAKGYWTSPGGQTPQATLYAAILREINVKGVESRFAKTDRGRFGLNTVASEAVVAPA
ncbi:MAG: restriction endonuclease, partial [Planctomycetaceae bacterium]|nr:restriction endonuclease [Planctomycetaceae bacterium]